VNKDVVEGDGHEHARGEAGEQSEPLRTASRNPTQGVMSGATRMPSNKTACESSRYPSPKIAPHTSEKTNNSMDG
jgi:hypothetical protein